MTEHTSAREQYPLEDEVKDAADIVDDWPPEDETFHPEYVPNSPLPESLRKWDYYPDCSPAYYESKVVQATYYDEVRPLRKECQ